MITAEQMLGLALASVVLIAVPGPSVLFIVGRALTLGRRHAFATIAGNTIGSLLAGVIVAVGLGELIERSETVFLVIKYVGAAYLIFLGIQAIRAHGAHAGEAAPVAARSLWRTAGQGLVVGISNPKVFILFAAILPQFVVPAHGPAVTQMLMLVGVPVLIGLVTDMIWALAASTARAWFTTSPQRMRRVGQVGGFSVLGLGVVTAVSGGPSHA